MYNNLPAYLQERNAFWTLFWFSSELSGEIGLIIRFSGAFSFVAFAWALLKRKEVSIFLFRKTVLFEGIHYLFYMPFIVNLFTRPASSVTALTVYRETAISYTIQTILITSSFIILYIKTRSSNFKPIQLFKWGAIAIVSYVFALWVKHFFFNLYALPIDISSPVLLLGLLNSTLTMLVAALVLLVTLKAVIGGKTTSFSTQAVGISFVLAGTYFIIYILVALFNASYYIFLPLTELWSITLAVLGAGFLQENVRN